MRISLISEASPLLRLLGSAVAASTLYGLALWRLWPAYTGDLVRLGRELLQDRTVGAIPGPPPTF